MPATQTPRFAVGASEYAKTDARQRLAHWWWCIALPVAALCIAGIGDNRYLYLALMLVFIAYPMVLSFAWLVITARKSMQLLTRPQQWHFSENGFSIAFYPFENDEESLPVRTLAVSNSDIADTRRSGRYWQFVLKKRDDDIHFLLIPAEYVPAENIDI